MTRELIWRNGVNQTDLGPIVWNDRARRSVMDRYAARGNPILLDINHQFNEDERAKWEATGAQPDTAGNGYLEIGADGSLWLVPVWNEHGAAKKRDYRFLSPDFAYDKKTREVLEIYRISLVAEPGTWHARMVASAKRKGRLNMGVSPELIAAITEMANLMASEQVSDALKEAVNKVVGLASGGDSPPETAAPEVDLAAQVPSDDKPLPGMMSKGNLAQLADAAVKRRLAIENGRLCGSLRGQFADELKAAGAKPLVPAEEKELSTYTDPDSLTRAIGLLKASGRDKRVEPMREPEKRVDATNSDTTVKANGYSAALQRAGIGGAR